MAQWFSSPTKGDKIHTGFVSFQTEKQLLIEIVSRVYFPIRKRLLFGEKKFFSLFLSFSLLFDFFDYAAAITFPQLWTSLPIKTKENVGTPNLNAARLERSMTVAERYRVRECVRERGRERERERCRKSPKDQPGRQMVRLRKGMRTVRKRETVCVCLVDRGRERE